MTGLISKASNRVGFLLTRGFSYALALAAAAVFIIEVDTGFHTWHQGFYQKNKGFFESLIAAIELMVLLSGLAPLLAALYFFVYLKKPLYNIIGFFAMITIVFIHFLVSIPAVHSTVFQAFALSTVELLLILLGLKLFQKFVVNDPLAKFDDVQVQDEVKRNPG